jgi:HPt (histidine-containing phosphotransfer) domain-containing protein
MMEPGWVDANLLDGLRALRQPGQPDPIARLLQVFEAETSRRLVELRDAVARGDGGTAERLAHSQKGSSGSIGALRLQRLSSELELRARNGELDASATKLVDELADAFRQFVEYVRAE